MNANVFPSPPNKVQYAFMRHTIELQFCMGSNTIVWIF